ncbi:uncharacterized protein ATC70_013352 [Mucor velutinosus]|uniref:Uncharacterized protein n=1 Tax=Mucor velutinosus TaxID=708070 RepID=A0AAN7D7T6_9FUNG|nr:hypothetical protein ATC70_013352 [Mucor velutinosus]
MQTNAKSKMVILLAWSPAISLKRTWLILPSRLLLPAGKEKQSVAMTCSFKKEMMLQTSEVSSTASKEKPNDLQNLMAKYAEAWKALKKNNPDKVNQLKLKAAEKTKARDAEPITSGGRLEVYHNNLNTITKSLVAMLDKYNFHAILYQTLKSN